MTAANGSAPSHNLDAERQAAIRAGLLSTLNASRLNPVAVAGAAPSEARSAELKTRITQLEQETQAAAQRAAQLETQLVTITQDRAALQLQKKEVDDQLAVALRRVEGLTEEVTAQRHKVVALEMVLKRITTHRWYRWWDKLRMITGKPALHGPRKDPLGIKGAMPN